ncbi:MAG: thioredoxin [Desulfuromonas sp.]|nr:MAG: thioredoxin [Desulfuromonas sp.]
MKLSIKLITTVCVFLLMLSGLALAADQPVKKAPNFTLEDVQGNKVSLADYKGKVVILNFWATWCPPCIEEMPSMEKLHQRYKGDDFVLLAVNVEENSRKIVQKFLKKNPYTFPVLLDLDARVQQMYGAYRFPETVIINRNGDIVTKVLGGRDWMDPEIVSVIDFMVKG